jgi:dihydrofolate synthase/folylpolyglutamate synthase
LRTGAYLSPHLHSFHERVEINESPVAPDVFAVAVQRVAAAAERVDANRLPVDRVTQFEALTAAAYVELGRHPVDVAVVEAGLGGRLDATNVLESEVQALTSIGLEHTALLGTTHTEIAAEKLAIVRRGATLVLGPALPADVRRLAEQVAKERSARLVRAAGSPRAQPGAPASFQLRNLAVAEACAHALLGSLYPPATKAAVASIRVPGRLDVVSRQPLIVVDAAHNKQGVEALIEALPELRKREGVADDAPLVAVVSILADKDADAMLGALIGAVGAVVLTGNSSPRARSPHDLAARARDIGGRPTLVEPDPIQAVQTARALVGRDGVVLVTGSICLVGDVLRTPAVRRVPKLRAAS